MVRSRGVKRLRVVGILSLVLLALTGCGGNSGEGAGSGVSRLTVEVAIPDQMPRGFLPDADSSGQPRQVEAFLSRLVMSVSGEGIAAPVMADCPVPGPMTEQCRSVIETPMRSWPG
jgi:hypothetical protein